jgi:hypothetical protein
MKKIPARRLGQLEDKKKVWSLKITGKNIDKESLLKNGMAAVGIKQLIRTLETQQAA